MAARFFREMDSDTDRGGGDNGVASQQRAGRSNKDRIFTLDVFQTRWGKERVVFFIDACGI